MADAQEIALERRRWDRLPFAVPVFIRGKDENGDLFQEFTTALDISGGGAAFMTRKRPPSRSPVSLEIPEAPGPKSERSVRRIEGILTRVETVLDWCICGLRFDRPLLQERRNEPKE